MDRKAATRDHPIAEIAEKQHGVVSIDQLHELGLKEGAIRARLRSGRLLSVHRGVYAVGHRAQSPPARWLAAVLAVRRRTGNAGGSVLDHWGAALSHRSAAGAWGLLRVSPGPVDVVVAGDGGKAKRQGIRIHRSRSLRAADVTLRHGIPVTTPARTIDDLRRVVSERELRRVIRQAEISGLPLGDQGGDRTRSDLELDFLRFSERQVSEEPDLVAETLRSAMDGGPAAAPRA